MLDFVGADDTDEEASWYEVPYSTAGGWYIWLPGEQFGQHSPKNDIRGECPQCQRGYKWPRWACLLREAYCPACGAKLKRLTEQRWAELKKHATLVRVKPELAKKTIGG